MNTNPVMLNTHPVILRSRSTPFGVPTGRAAAAESASTIRSILWAGLEVVDDLGDLLADVVERGKKRFYALGGRLVNLGRHRHGPRHGGHDRSAGCIGGRSRRLVRRAG